MHTITGYELVEPISRDASLSVFRARKLSDAGSCIVKCATGDHAREETVRFLKNEYAITSRLSVPGIIRSLEIIRKDNGVFIVQEPTSCAPLSRSIRLWQRNVRMFLKSAMHLCDLLHELHKQNLIHKNISPDGIFADPGTGECLLTNFYVSSRTGDEAARPASPNYYAHSLPYISPEQTGRTNIPIDARTDFYSLGVVFYEMLTGHVPFFASDPADLLYSHVAKHPVPPVRRAPAVPAVLSDIVLKLIAKSPDDRYQTAHGLKADLEACLSQYDRTGSISGVTPGAHDFATGLILSETLLGRDGELSLLKAALGRVSQGNSEAFLMSGPGGIGKTRLLDEFRRSLQDENVAILCGTCNESTSITPYFALSTALADAIHTIIAQGEHAIAAWRERFALVVGNYGGLIARVVPELSMIIGPCPLEPAGTEVQSQNRFRTLFIQFLRTFVRSRKVMVVIIDDLQWADSALLNILKPAFFDDPDGAILLIGAGRLKEEASDEIGKSFHALGCAVTRIDLPPLGREATRDIIVESLHCSPEKAIDLAGVLYEKTRGNPLFLKEYLKTLHSRRFLFRAHAYPEKVSAPAAPEASGWEWDIERIRQLEIAENVIGLVTDEFSLLSPDAQTVMEWAACSGAEFCSEVLGSASEMSAERVAAGLHECAEKGIISESPGPSAPAARMKIRYRFSHDRVREALAARIDQKKRSGMHLHMGRLLLLNYGDADDDASIFEIVGHFNPFESAIHSPEERRDLANLNHEAGVRAMNASANEIALLCFQHAIRFLPEDSWKTAHSLRFKIELASGECESLLSSFDAAQKRLKQIAAQACTPWEKGSVCLVFVVHHKFRLNYPEAIQKGVEGLAALGISLSEHPSLFQMAAGLLKAFAVMWRIRPASLLGKEIMRPAEGQKLVVRLFMHVWELSFMSNREKLMISVVLRMIVFSRKYGNQNASAIAYCCWGILLSMLYRNPGKGLPYAETASRLADRFDDPFIKGKTRFLQTAFFSHLDGHISKTIDAFTAAIAFSAEVGDINNTGMCSEGIAVMNVFVGKPLVEVRKFADETCAYLLQKGFTEKNLYLFNIVRDWTRRLQTKLVEPGDLAASSAKVEDLSLMDKGLFLLFEMYRAFLAGDYGAAARCSQSLKGNPFLEPTGYFCAFFYFLDALTLGRLPAAGRDAPPGRRVKTLKKRLAQLKRFSDRCPVNFRCFYLLVKAELLRLLERNWDAAACYQSAIDEAEARGFVHYQALAYEAAARFHAAGNNKPLVKLLLKGAVFCYGEWGADGKTASLRAEFPDVNDPGGVENGSDVVRSAIAGHPSEIDFSVFMKAVEAISTEIILDRLLERLIRIVIEYAGAQRGVLVLNQDEGAFVRIDGALASAIAPTNVIEARAMSVPLAKADLPQGIVTFVDRTREPVRLENAAVKGRFTGDPYIRKTAMKSVLCVPLIKLDQVRGVIYLENALIEGAFPPSILQVLKLLSGQAVISIENALFHDLEMKHLQAKVNPHFIFNALSSIAELCNRNPQEAENAIVKLSVLYRYILTAEMRLVTIEEEIEIVRKYLAIEKLRFGDRLNFSVHVMGGPTTVRMPCLLIQPLVENCIKHGISPRSSGGSIVITVVISEKTCAISVADDGVGLDTKRQDTGYGLTGIKKRLALQYGSDYSFNVRGANGCTVEMTIPV